MRTATMLLAVVFMGAVSEGQAAAPAMRITADATAVEVRWEFVPNPPLEVVTEVVFAVEGSPDFLNWEVVAEKTVRVPPHTAVREIVRMERMGSSRFFRVRTSLPGVIGDVTAATGAEVYGLSALFEEELDRIGEITLEEFAALYSPVEAPLIPYDPTAGEYWAEFNSDPAEVVTEQGHERLWDFRLNEEELEVFRRNGFVVSERLGTHSFAEMFYRIYTDDLPVFISADAVLQAWHRTFSSILMELEATVLRSILAETLSGMQKELAALYEELGDGVLGQSVLDADLVIGVAGQLMNWISEPFIASSVLGQKEIVDRTLGFITDQQAIPYRNRTDPGREFDLFGRRATAEPKRLDVSLEFFDFTQFTLRGHYDQSPELERYFRALMWLNLVDFRIAGPRSSTRELGTAIVLNELLRRSGMEEEWQSFQHLIELIVGMRDSLGVDQLSELVLAAGYATPVDIKTVADLEGIQELIMSGWLGVQQIVGHPFVVPSGPSRFRLPRVASMGASIFLPDGWAISKVVYPEVREWRTKTSALDVGFSVLANDDTVSHLVARMKDGSVVGRDQLPYQHNLLAVRRTLDAQSESIWSASVANGWLGALRTLSSDVNDPRRPEVLRSAAWRMKNLNTQLASWTHLKHDTILYGKQPYSGFILCFFPHGYVEPVRGLYESIFKISERLIRAVERIEGEDYYEVSLPEFGELRPVRGGVRWRQVAVLRHIQWVMFMLSGIAKNQLDGTDLADDQLQFVRTMMESTDIVYEGDKRYSGWYPRMFYKNIFEHLRPDDGGDYDFRGSDKWDPVIADVHTDPNRLGPTMPPGVLHQAVGNVNFLLMSVPTATGLRVYAGPVLSHYEFYTEGLVRIADGEWERRASGDLPPPPEWTSSYLVRGTPKLPWQR